jgi:nitroimidazol reductase NimA-like FMN-containing flavoprotein (pyridoxamine 5'-phosphate oxidase superfamily)
MGPPASLEVGPLVLIPASPPALGVELCPALDEGMGMVDSQTWMEHLSPRDCWELLASTPLGRLGVLVDSAPEIYPVNHVVDGETIVFRTEGGEKLRGLDRSPSVCFEVDGFDPAEHTGWSVLVKGRAREVTAAEEERRLLELELTYWSVGPKPVWVRIEPVEVTGRRIVRPAGRSRP